MSSIAPMTHRPPPAPSPDDGPVVSLHQRIADRLAQTPAEATAARTRKKKERGEEQAALAGASVAQPSRMQGPEALSLRRGEAPPPTTSASAPDRRDVVEPGRSPSVAHPPASQPAGEGGRVRAHEATFVGVGQAPRNVATQDVTRSASALATEEPGEDESPSAPAQPQDTTGIGVVVPARMEPAALPNVAAPPGEAPHVPHRTPPAATPAAPPNPDAHASTVTVAFQSWGPGHEVRAHWQPGSGVLVPGSERVGQALAAAAQQPNAGSIVGDGWRIDATDADPERRERPRRDAEQDA